MEIKKSTWLAGRSEGWRLKTLTRCLALGFGLFPCMGAFQGLTPEPALPAFDLAAQQADLVLVVQPEKRQADRVFCKVLQSMGVPFRGERVLVREPLGLPRPQRLGAGGAQLVFLVKAARGDGYFVLQHPGTLVRWTEARRKELGELLRLLLEKKGGKERARGLLRLALGRGNARARGLALLSLCRSGEIHLANAGQRRLLRQGLEDARGTPMLVRDLSARALAGLGDRALPGVLLKLLREGKAHGLGRCFGGLLRQMLGGKVAALRLGQLLRGLPGDSEVRAAVSGVGTR